MIPDDTRSSSSGFGVVEVLISAATFAIVAFVLVGIVHEYSLTAQTLTAKQHSHLDVARLLDAWQTDSSSADAVFIPDADVFGSDNTAVPHEIDFYTKDAGNRPYFWAYYFDSNAHTLQRYDYASPGGVPQKDGNAYANITQFYPSLHAISEISNPASPIYAPLFGTAANYDVALGFPKVVGGTHIVHIDLRTPYETVPAELEAGGAPSGFTVVLNYTPAPKPTPKLALRTWPAAVRYGLNNSDVADATTMPAPFNLARVLNSLIGGGIAVAAGCKAQAFTDSTMRTPDTVGDPVANALLGGPPGPGGCYGGQIVAYEASGRVATYAATPGFCGSSVRLGSWGPSNVGASAYNSVVGGSSPVVSCNITISDGTGTTPTLGKGLVTASVLTCSGPYIFSGGQPYCNWHLLFQSGYSGTTGGAVNSDGWYAQPAASTPPVVDCSVPPDSNGAGGCQLQDNGAIEFCYNAQQNTPNISITTAQGNTTGFSCSDLGNSHDWPVIPCINPPANPRYCSGPRSTPAPGPNG